MKYFLIKTIFFLLSLGCLFISYSSLSKHVESLPVYIYSNYMYLYIIFGFFIFSYVAFFINLMDFKGSYKKVLFISFIFIFPLFFTFCNIILIQYKKINKLHFEKSIESLGSDGKMIIYSKMQSDAYPTLLIWGDSHAGMLNFGIGNDKFNIIKLITSGCPSLLETVRRDSTGNSTNCNEVIDGKIVQDYIAKISPDVVVIVNRYNLYLYGWRKKNKLQDANHYLYTHGSKDSSFLSRAIAIESGLSKSIEFINSIDAKAVLVKPFPSIAHLGSSKELILKGIKKIPSNKDMFSFNVIDSIIYNIQHKDIFIIDSKKAFAEKSEYIPMYDKNIYFATYGDDNHLSEISSITLGDYILNKVSDKFYSH